MVKKIVLSFLWLSLATLANAQTAPTLPPQLNTALYLGIRSETVRQLQIFLAQYKDIYPEGLATGYFGLLTEAAVKRWQTKNGIEAVGIVGPKTRAKLAEIRAQLSIPAPVSQPGVPSTTIPAPTPLAPATSSVSQIKSGSGVVGNNQYLTIGAGTFLFAGAYGFQGRGYLLPGDPAAQIADQSGRLRFSNCEDIDAIDYTGIADICKFTDPAQHVFTNLKDAVRIYDIDSRSHNVEGGSGCYNGLILFKQNNIYGAVEPTDIDFENKLHYRYWYDESGGANFGTLCSSSNAKNSTASLLESLKSALEQLKSLVK